MWSQLISGNPRGKADGQASADATDIAQGIVVQQVTDTHGNGIGAARPIGPGPTSHLSWPTVELST